MKQGTFLKTILASCMVLTTLLSSCGKGNDSKPDTGNGGYPKEVNVEYRVSNLNGVSTGSVLYVNSTGGNTSVDQVTLPYSVKLKRTVKQYDNLGVTFSASANGEVKVEILVEGQVLETQSFAGTSYLSGTAVYLFQ